MQYVWIINTFRASVLFEYPQKTLENLYPLKTFSDVFKGYRFSDIFRAYRNATFA